MTKHKRVIEGWVVTPGAGGAFDYGFHCHVCDMHVERLTFEEARGVAGAHLHRVEVGCPFCRDGLSAQEMVDRGLTLCGPCHGRLSESGMCSSAYSALARASTSCIPSVVRRSGKLRPASGSAAHPCPMC